MSLTFQYGDKTVQEFVHLYSAGQLNLEPGFQRRSVWTVKDRQKLVESIWANCPIPSLFLYRSNDAKGRLKYDVIDGKQRLESILGFQRVKGFKGERFSATLRVGHADTVQPYDWTKLRKIGLEHQLMAYKIQTVEVSGELGEIIDLFVRINSTGKRLTGAEKRHAKYYHSEFLRRAGQLAEQRRQFFRQHGIMSASQMSRMKHVELVSELLASTVAGNLLNKKSALDSIIGGQTIAPQKLKASGMEFTRTLNRLEKMFPKLKETRFRNSVDFYTLFMFVWKLERDGCILTNAARNSQAQALLLQLSNGVDQVRSQQRKAEGARPDQRLFADYVLTIQGDTDSFHTRQRRATLLTHLLGGIFETKDAKRGFTVEQRRLMWNTDQEKRCSGCKARLSWTNFTVDHVQPHSKGGRTSLKNAALLCRSCNAKKGNRRAA